MNARVVPCPVSNLRSAAQLEYVTPVLDERFALVWRQDISAPAPMYLTRELLPGMVARGGGHVVNMASAAGSCCVGSCPYGGSTRSAGEWLGVYHAMSGFTGRA